jgi:hypothetical protein
MFHFIAKMFHFIAKMFMFEHVIEKLNHKLLDIFLIFFKKREKKEVFLIFLAMEYLFHGMPPFSGG